MNDDYKHCEKEYGYWLDGSQCWGFRTVADAFAQANIDYNGDWDRDNTGLIARYILPNGHFQDVNAPEVGGCNEPIGDEYFYDENGFMTVQED